VRFSSTRPRPAGLAAILTALAVSAAVAFAAPAGAAPPTTDSGSAVTAPKTGAQPPAGHPTGPISQNSPMDGNCNPRPDGTGEFCLYYFYDSQGSVADGYWDDPNLAENVFNGPGAGQWQPVANNAESVFNRDYWTTFLVFTSPNYTGYSGTVAPNHWGNFTSTFSNQVESFRRS
jgi:hypothetical protein